MESSWDKISFLLALDKRKGTEDEMRVRAFPVILALMNLLFCSYMDHCLRQDQDGHYLGLLLFLESSILVLTAVGVFGSSGLEIVQKTSVFPMKSGTRLTFVVMSILRKPVSVAVWLTTIIFFVVYSYPSFNVIAVSIALFLLLVLTLILLTSVAGITLARSSQPIAGLAVVTVGVVLVVLISSIVFRANGVLTTLPILSWVIHGVLAAQRSQIELSLLNCSYLIIACLVVVLFGRRFC